MSRIGNKPVALPAGVEVTVDAKNVVTVKGPKGTLQEQVSKLINIEVKENEVVLTRPSDAREYRSQHGLARTLINNMVVGVTNGYEKKLQLVGVGYRAEGISTETPDATTILVKGIDKAAVGNYAANIRAWRQPEPYKGKGIKYADEVIRRKEGKAGAK